MIAAMSATVTPQPPTEEVHDEEMPLLDDNQIESNIETLYAAVPFLARIGSDGEGDEMDQVLIQRCVDSLNRVCEARHIRTAGEEQQIETSVIVLLWFLAFSIGFTATFMQCGNLKLQRAMITLVIVGLMFSMIVLVDVWQPWCGFIQVDTSIFDKVRYDISLVLIDEQSDAAAMMADGSSTNINIDHEKELKRAQKRRSSIIALCSPHEESNQMV